MGEDYEALKQISHTETKSQACSFFVSPKTLSKHEKRGWIMEKNTNSRSDLSLSLELIFRTLITFIVFIPLNEIKQYIPDSGPILVFVYLLLAYLTMVVGFK